MTASPDPVVGGFHPDPSVCRVGDDYYLACSSFAYFPGIPIFHSRDLRTWRQLGNALDRPSQLDLAGTPSSGGVYAPTLRQHDGRFWIINTNVPRGNFIVTADDPAGPWSDPVWLPGLDGIDPDLAWDDDGTCWCTYHGIRQVRIDPRTGAVLDEPRRLWSGTPGTQWPEAPHLYRIGADAWYLLIAEGGTDRGHCVSVARGPSPAGPFEPGPANPILTARSTARPVQNTGHADLVEAADGSWWLVFLGVRVRGGTPGHHVLGRETFLAPVTWDAAGWPVVGEIVSGPPATAERDDFDAADLHPRWVSPRARPDLSLADPPGWLSLRASGSLDDPTPAFLGRRPAHLGWTGRALVDAAAGVGGLALRMDERHHYEVEVRDGEAVAWARIGPLRQRLGALRLPPGPVVLRVTAGPFDEQVASGGSADAGPDLVRLGVERDGEFAVLAELDGRYLSTEVAGGFLGRVVGMYAAEGTVRFDWFGYAPE